MIRSLLTAMFLLVALLGRAQGPGPGGPGQTAVSVVSLTRANPSPTAAASVGYTLTVSTAVGGLSTANFSLLTTGAVSGASVTGIAGSGTVYTLTVGTGTGSGTLQLQLTNSTGVTSTFSNLPFDGEIYTIDKTAPATPVVTTPANGNSINTNTPAYSGTAEANSTVTVYVDGTSIGTTTATAGSFSLTQPTALAQGSHTVYVTATDAVGNTSSNSNTNTFTVDTTSPTVSISSSAGASGSTTNTTPIPFTVTFSESVTGFVAGDVTVTNGTIGVVSGSGTTYTFTVTPTANGVVTVNVPAVVAQDAAGNGNTAATQFSITYSQLVTAAPVVTTPANGSTITTRTPAYLGTAPANSTVTVYVDGTAIGTTTATVGGSFSLAQPTNLADGSHTVRATAQLSGQAVSANSNTNTFTIDATAPTVSITSSAGASGGSTGISPIPFTVTFSEVVTGFVAGDVAVTNGTLTGFAGSGTTYTFNVTPAGAGAVTVNVAANVAQDAATNGNTAATQFSIAYAQPATAAPVVTTPANGSTLNTATPAYAGTAPASSTVTVYVDGTSIGTTTATAGGSFSLTQPTALAQGTHTVYATAQTSGSAVSANSNTNTFTVDTVSPTVVISSSAGASGSTTTTTPIPFTVTFSEVVTGFVAGDVTVTNGTIGVVSGSGTTYTFTVTPTTAGTVTTVNVPAVVAQDAAGNGNTAATQFSITYNQLVTAAPVVTTPANGSLQTTTTPTYAGTAPANSTVTVYVDGTSIGTTTATAGGSFSLTQPTALAQGSHVVRATAQSSGSTVSANSNTNTFTIDTVAPTVAITSTASNPTSVSPIPVTVTFSESVTGFVVGDIAVTNGTLSGFTAVSGTTYTVNVTPTASGLVTVNVAANVAQDAATNGNTAATQLTRTYNAPLVLAVTAVSPVRNEKSAPRTSNVAVTFNQTLTNNAATQGALKVYSAQRGGQLNRVGGGTATVSGNTLTLDPANDFRAGEVVSGTITTAAASAGGNLAIPQVVQFTAAVGGTGRGNFQPGSDPGVGAAPASSTLGDVDGDGDLDLLVGNYGSGTVSVRLNDGAGNFTGSQTVAVGANPVQVVLGDVDGDGDLDLLTANVISGTSTVSVRLNNGTGTFSGSQEVGVGSLSYSAALGDVDGDGDLDLLTANYGSATVSVRLNDGAGNFSGSQNVAAVASAYNVVLGDVDSDGDLDFVVSNYGNSTVNVRLNDGTGTFSGTQSITVGSAPINVALGDIDGDGDLDFLTANNTSSTVSVSLNNGAGIFGGSQDLSVAPNPYGVTLGDVDADGDLDFLVSSHSTNNVALWLNNGTGTFTNTRNISVGDGPYNVAVGDLDGDGDLDFVTPNQNTTTASVRLNQAGPTIISFTPPSGPVGTVVTITGTLLTGTTAVAFNGTAASSFTVNSATSITATVAAGTSTGLITVTTPGGTATSATNFTITLPATAAPVVITPANGSTLTTTIPTYSGTAPANSTVAVYVDGSLLSGTVTADGSGNWTKTQPSALAQGSHTVYATAQSSGSTVSANSNTNTFTVDSVQPTVTISSSAGASGSTTSTSPIPFTVTFSESVTGFVAGDVTVTNGTISVVSGSGTTYTFTVTPTTAGTVTTVNVAANVAQDAATNGNTAATQFSITYNQAVTAAPVVTTPANGSTVSTATPAYAGTAPANSTVTVYVDGTAIGTTTATAGGSFSLTQPTALAQGSHTVYATAQTSGSAVSANSNTNTFTVDTVSPTVVISSSAGASGSTTNTTPIPFTVTFSEVVTGFVAGDVTVTNGTIGVVSGSGTTYTFTVTPTTAGTVTTVNVPAVVAQDAAGNGNTAATQFNITYVAPITVTIWTGAISTDWFTAANWTSGVPTATLDATIPAGTPRYPVLTAGTATAKTLTLANGGTLTQSAGTLDLKGNFANNGTFTATGGLVSLTGAAAQAVGGSSFTSFWNLSVGAAGATLSGATAMQRVLTLNGNLTTSGQTFTLLSDASGTALVVNNGTSVVNGDATVQRYIDPTLNAGPGYRHYSAPVSGTPVADLATVGYTPVVNPAYNSSATPGLVTPFPTVFGYDQSRLTLTNSMGAFDKGFVSPTSTASMLIVGLGYTVNIAGTQLVDFVGTLNNGTRTMGLSRNTGPTAADAGWQLLGNPYPAPLDYSLIAQADRPNLDAAIYVFSSTSQYGGQYRGYVNGVGNPVVPVAQGFFTRVSPGQTSGSLTFRNSQRLTAPDATTFQRTTVETRPLVQLTLRGATGVASDEAYVYFQAGATAGIDPQYDAVKLPNSTGLNLSTTAVGTELAINGLPLMGTTALTVPLSVYGPASGTYTLQAAQVLNFGAGEQPFLHDLQLGTLIDLNLQPTYTFTLNAFSTAPRFELVFGARQVLGTASATLAAQVGLFPNPAHAAVSVELPASLSRKPVTAALVDGLGRVVYTQVLPAGISLHVLPLTNVATGVYSLRLQTEAGIIVKKLVVE